METYITSNLIKYASNITTKKKEKLDIIVEPLQACYMLSLLAFLPNGTKFSIQNNILYLQEPSVVQGVSRWYNSDTKNDIQYLVVIVKRFLDFYKNKHIKLYDLMKKILLLGLEKLIETYMNADKNFLIQTLQICKILINDEKTEFLELIEKKELDTILINVTDIYSDECIELLYIYLINIEKDPDNINNYYEGICSVFKIYNQKIKLWISKNLSN